MLTSTFKTKPGSSSGQDVIKYPTCSNIGSLAAIFESLPVFKVIVRLDTTVGHIYLGTDKAFIEQLILTVWRNHL
jgi:hypothetical protein